MKKEGEIENKRKIRKQKTMKEWKQISLQKLKHEDKETNCPECGSNKLEYEKGELVCKKCGLVVE